MCSDTAKKSSDPCILLDFMMFMVRKKHTFNVHLKKTQEISRETNHKDKFLCYRVLTL